jgi:hypothetical protein
VVAVGKQILVRRVTRAAEWIDYDPTGGVEAIVQVGHGPTTKPQK